jgi:hypothetical protein
MATKPHWPVSYVSERNAKFLLSVRFLTDTSSNVIDVYLYAAEGDKQSLLFIDSQAAVNSTYSSVPMALFFDTFFFAGEHTPPHYRDILDYMLSNGYLRFVPTDPRS